MTPAELDAFIDAYIRNSAITAFTDLRLNTILHALVTGGITDSFDTYDLFKAAIAANKVAGEDYFMRAFVKSSREGQDNIFEYIPSQNFIMWTASQKYEQL